MSAHIEEGSGNHRGRAVRSGVLLFFAIAIALYVIWLAREVFLLLYVSALFAVVLMPVVRGIQRLKIRRWSPGRGLAIFFLLAGIVLAITVFIAFAVPPVLRDLREFLSEGPTRLPHLLDRVNRVPVLKSMASNLTAKIQNGAAAMAAFIFNSLGDWAKSAVNLITGLLLTVYFMIEGEVAYHWLLSFVPPEPRLRLDRTLIKAEVRMGNWLLGQLSLMLVLGLSSAAVFGFLHLRYAYALAVLMGAFNLIPVMGAVISMAFVILVASMDSWGKVLGVVIFYAIYAQVENAYLTPKIMRKSVGLEGLAVIVALLFGATFAGILGAMVAVPTAVLVAELLNEYLAQPDAVVHSPS